MDAENVSGEFNNKGNTSQQEKEQTNDLKVALS